jgi:hypothetical protein
MKSVIYRNYQIFKLTGEPDGLSERIDLFVKEHLSDLNVYESIKYSNWLLYGKDKKNIIFNYDTKNGIFTTIIIKFTHFLNPILTLKVLMFLSFSIDMLKVP